MAIEKLMEMPHNEDFNCIIKKVNELIGLVETLKPAPVRKATQSNSRKK